ncbi:hypothetical protein Paride_0226 [Pseudomonas phage Paride]|nr:hypothetical protein Deiofobo_0226 [Pseudomonas phage Deifobo]WPK39936.1 hypothetical protein ETTORE_0227 [Pseudomonas phage Ettore]WPK40456.1 hypothetical protein Paride_0226 [Pseudomonas phage Paride]
MPFFNSKKQSKSCIQLSILYTVHSNTQCIVASN